MSTDYERARIKLSISPALNQKLEEAADALGINPTSLATFAFAIGLRALSPMITVQTNPAIKQVINDESNRMVSDLSADAAALGIPVNK